MKFAAIEVKPGEMVEDAIGKLMHLAKDKGILFNALEQFDTFKINQTRFVRFRSDLDVEKLREALLAERGVILPHAKDIRYEVSLSGGLKGTYSASSMHATPRLTEHKKYRGTRDRFWDRQFKV